MSVLYHLIKFYGYNFIHDVANLTLVNLVLPFNMIVNVIIRRRRSGGGCGDGWVTEGWV